MSAPKYIIDYDPVTGDSFTDGEVVDYVDTVIGFVKYWRKPYSVKAGTENIVNEFRLRLAREEIAFEDIEFRYNGVKVEVNEYGGLPPDAFHNGYLHAHVRRSCEMVRVVLTRRKAEGREREMPV